MRILNFQTRKSIEAALEQIILQSENLGMDEFDDGGALDEELEIFR